jgi:hypothetical protein
MGGFSDRRLAPRHRLIIELNDNPRDDGLTDETKFDRKKWVGPPT